MRTLLATVFCGVLCFAQSASSPALEGMDPVLLTQGKEVPGKETLSVRHNGFWYTFSSAQTKEQFEKDPGRYGIQLDGACARMGAPTRGNADVSFVHKGRIYIFGSSQCYKLFSADPEKYLSTGNAPAWNP